MCPVPIIFYWRMSGLREVEWWTPFNVHYYFLNSIAAAGRLQLLIFFHLPLSTLENCSGSADASACDWSWAPNYPSMDAEEMLTWFIVSSSSETMLGRCDKAYCCGMSCRCTASWPGGCLALMPASTSAFAEKRSQQMEMGGAQNQRQDGLKRHFLSEIWAWQWPKCKGRLLDGEEHRYKACG